MPFLNMQAAAFLILELAFVTGSVNLLCDAAAMPLAFGELACVHIARRRQHPSPMELATPKLANVCPSWACVTPHTMQAAVEEASLVHLAACPTERALAMVALLGIALPNVLVSFLRRHSTQSPLDHEIAWLGGAAALLVLAAVLRDGQA